MATYVDPGGDSATAIVSMPCISLSSDVQKGTTVASSSSTTEEAIKTGLSTNARESSCFPNKRSSAEELTGDEECPEKPLAEQNEVTRSPPTINQAASSAPRYRRLPPSPMSSVPVPGHEFSTPTSVTRQQQPSVAHFSHPAWHSPQTSGHTWTKSYRCDASIGLSLPPTAAMVVLRDAIQRLSFECRPQLTTILALEAKRPTSNRTGSSRGPAIEQRTTSAVEATTAAGTARSALISVSALLDLLLPGTSASQLAAAKTMSAAYDHPSTKVATPRMFPYAEAAAYVGAGSHVAPVGISSTSSDETLASYSPTPSLPNSPPLQSRTHCLPWGGGGMDDSARISGGTGDHSRAHNTDCVQGHIDSSCRSLRAAADLLHHMIATQSTIEAAVATAASDLSSEMGCDCDGGPRRGKADLKRKTSPTLAAPHKQGKQPCQPVRARHRQQQQRCTEASGESDQDKTMVAVGSSVQKQASRRKSNTSENSSKSSSSSSSSSSSTSDAVNGPSSKTKSGELGKGEGFKAIVGGDVAKTALQVNVVLPLTLGRSVFRGLRSCGHVLLYGPPGTGKTSLAQATAMEAGALFVPLSPSACLSKYQGESERAIRKIFSDAKARTTQPTVIFFDEIDALAPSRSGGGAGDVDLQARRVLSELLVQLSALDNDNGGEEDVEDGEEEEEEGTDPNAISSGRDENIASEGKEKRPREGHTEGEESASDDSGGEGSFEEEQDGLPKEKAAASKQRSTGKKATRQSVVVMGATNMLEDIDPALLRRFHSRVLVDLPICSERVKLLSHFLRTVAHALSLSDFQHFGRRTEGWSGSDIQLLCRDAAMRPLRKLFDPQPGPESTGELDSQSQQEDDVQPRDEIAGLTEKSTQNGNAVFSTKEDSLKSETTTTQVTSSSSLSTSTSISAIPFVSVSDVDEAFRALFPTVAGAVALNEPQNSPTSHQVDVKEETGQVAIGTPDKDLVLKTEVPSELNMQPDLPTAEASMTSSRPPSPTETPQTTPWTSTTLTGTCPGEELTPHFEAAATESSGDFNENPCQSTDEAQEGSVPPLMTKMGSKSSGANPGSVMLPPPPRPPSATSSSASASPRPTTSNAMAPPATPIRRWNWKPPAPHNDEGSTLPLPSK